MNLYEFYEHERKVRKALFGTGGNTYSANHTELNPKKELVVSDHIEIKNMSEQLANKMGWTR